MPLHLLVLSAIALGGCAHASSTSADVERYILDCSRDWAASVVTGDVSRRRIYFADDFVGTDRKGRRYTKAQITRDTGPARSIVVNRLEHAQVRRFGDVAVVHGTERWQRKGGSSGRWSWTDIWALRDGRRQIVAAQDAEALD